MITIQSQNWTRIVQSNSLIWPHGLPHLGSRALGRARRLAHARARVRGAGRRHPPALSRQSARAAHRAARGARAGGGAARESQHGRRRLPEPSRHRPHREHARLGQRDAAAAAPAIPGRAIAIEGAIDLQQASPPAWPGLAGVMSEVALVGCGARLAGRLRRARAGRAARGDRRALLRSAASRPRPSEILVTTGAQSAIHLLASVLLGRGDRVLIETPTYPHAADALRRAGARLVGVPVTTDDGWDLDRAEQAFARTLPVHGVPDAGLPEPDGPLDDRAWSAT